MDKQTWNVLLLSVAFLFVFTAFNTSSLIQKTVVDGINHELDVHWDGFYALCITYTVFSFSNFFAPSLLSIIGVRAALFLSSLSYLLYICSFLYPLPYSLNICSFFVGFGAAVIWTSQGSFLTQNSNQDTLDRNAGIFWAIFQGSLLFGNAFIFWQFQGVSEISYSTRMITYTSFAIICTLGCLTFLFLRKSENESSEDSVPMKPLEQFLSSFKLLRIPRMLLLVFAFFYTGMILSFYSGVFVTAVGSTLAFGSDSSKLIGLCGMCIGIGEILAGSLFGLMGKRFNQNGRSPILLLGYLMHMVAFFLTYLNLPDASGTGHKTHDHAYLTPSIPLALMCAFLFGFGDACFNTQIYSILGTLFPSESNLTSSAFALFKFTQSISAAICFFISQQELTMFVHICIQVISATIGIISFMFAEFSIRSENQLNSS